MSGRFVCHGDKPAVPIRSWDDIPRAIALLQQVGGTALLRIPLLQALHRGLIGYLDVDQRTPSRTVKAFLATVRLPAIVIVADDGNSPAGPDAIPHTERLLRWAAQVIIHGTGGEVEHYQAVVMAAQVSRRVLLIECPSRLVEAYEAAAKRWAPRASRLIVRPFAGGQHPTTPLRETVQ